MKRIFLIEIINIWLNAHRAVWVQSAGHCAIYRTSIEPNRRMNLVCRHPVAISPLINSVVPVEAPIEASVVGAKINRRHLRAAPAAQPAAQPASTWASLWVKAPPAYPHP